LASRAQLLFPHPSPFQGYFATWAMSKILTDKIERGKGYLGELAEPYPMG